MGNRYLIWVKNNLNPYKRQLIRKYFVNIFHPIIHFNLNTLSDLYGSDKSNKHGYTTFYETHFSHLKRKRISLLEIGVGGYEDPKLGGASLRMWKKYFRHGFIYGIDIYDKGNIDEPRIKTFVCSQTDEIRLKNILKGINALDIIIDDGSHNNNDVINTFNILFPLLKDGGYYAIEDVHTSYRDGYSGDSKNLYNNTTIMNYFKILCDFPNIDFIDNSKIDNKLLELKIKSIHFYRGLIIINK